MDNLELRQLSKAYLASYADRYNRPHRDSNPTYSGFSVWAKTYSKTCPVFEKKLLKKFSCFLKVQNSNPSTRLYSVGESDLEEFLNNAILQDLLLP